MRRTVCSVLILSMVLFATPGWAEESVFALPSQAWTLVQAEEARDAGVPEAARSLSPEELELDQRLRKLSLSRSQVDLRPGRRAQLAGGILLGAGLLSVALALATCSAANGSAGTDCREGRANGIAIGGGIVGGIGLVTLISGFSTLSARQKEIKEYDRRIRALVEERERAAPKVDARLSLGQETKLTLSWGF